MYFNDAQWKQCKTISKAKFLTKQESNDVKISRTLRIFLPYKCFYFNYIISYLYYLQNVVTYLICMEYGA